MKEKNQMRYAIIGAGPMGLMAAIDLLVAGHSVDLYERDDRVGGMSAVFPFAGYDIERYYHFVCKTDYPLFDLLDRLNLSDRLKWTDTNMGFFYNGKLYDWGTPLSLLKFPHLDLISKFRYGLMAMRVKSINNWETLDTINAKDWIRDQIGGKAYDILWRSLFELKLHEYTANTSAAWIGTRIKRVALSRRSINQETMGYIEGGSSILLDAMKDFIEKRNGNIFLSSKVDKVTSVAGCATGLIVNGVAKSYDKILSTVPIQYVPTFLPELPEYYLKKIKSIQNIPVACVILKMKRQVTDKFWLNINDPTIGIPGLIEYSNLNPDTKGVVYAPFYMPKTHPKWQHSNDQLIEEVKKYIKKVNPEIQPEDFVAAHCHRYEFAQTICPPGFYKMLPDMVTPIKNFFMADTAYYYPEDRSICESVSTASKLARTAMIDF